MEFIDLKIQFSKIEDKITKSINEVLHHGKYIMGPEVEKLENQLSDYVNSKYCVSCSSGTDALLMSLLAINLKPGDAVITTPFTFIATAEVISLLGATPVFVDIDPKTFNINPELIEDTIVDINNNSNINIKAIIPVNIFGLPADYNKILKIVDKYNIHIIEDAAQSFGAKYYDKKSGNLSNLSCTSFFPAKPLGCYGDGGAIFTSDDNIYNKLISLRIHGKGNNKYDNVNIGINGRLDTIQAAILIEKLKIFKEEVLLRQQVADKYSLLLKKYFNTQCIPDNYESAWAQFCLLADTKDERNFILQYLKKYNIPTAIYYPKPLHLQPVFGKNNYNNNSLIESEKISNKIFSIPMHPYLSDDNINQISDILIKAKHELS